MVSVVVPLYNQGEYITQCIESIQRQSYEDIEIVIIDDGSEDMGYSICQKLQKEDNRIRLFHQENRGSVSARKLGVKNAEGELVIFVDGDDYIDKHLIETLINSMDTDTDMVASGMISSSYDASFFMGNAWKAGVYDRNRLEKNFQNLIFFSAHNKSGVFQSACAKLYRKNQLWDCMKAEDERITLGDDAAIVFLYILQAKKIVLRDDNMYYYRVNNQSMTHSLTCDIFEKINIFLEYMREHIKAYPAEWELEKQLKQYIMHFLQMSIRSVYDIAFLPHYYISPRLKNEDKIVLYGAGKVGKSLYNNFTEQGIEIVSWVDKSQNGKIYFERQIQSVQVIHDITYDYIVVALLGKEKAQEVREQLLQMGIPAEKIYWEKPKVSNGMFVTEF